MTKKEQKEFMTDAIYESYIKVQDIITELQLNLFAKFKNYDVIYLAIMALHKELILNLVNTTEKTFKEYDEPITDTIQANYENLKKARECFENILKNLVRECFENILKNLVEEKGATQ